MSGFGSLGARNIGSHYSEMRGELWKMIGDLMGIAIWRFWGFGGEDVDGGFAKFWGV